MHVLTSEQWIHSNGKKKNQNEWRFENKFQWTWKKIWDINVFEHNPEYFWQVIVILRLNEKMQVQ